MTSHKKGRRCSLFVMLGFKGEHQQITFHNFLGGEILRGVSKISCLPPSSDYKKIGENFPECPNKTPCYATQKSKYQKSHSPEFLFIFQMSELITMLCYAKCVA